MKKNFLIITMLLLFTYTLSSCNKLNIVEERRIVLGEEVSSQTINVNDEVINIDKDSDFYLTLNQLDTFKKTDNVAYKASYDVKYKIENEKQMYINENYYFYMNTTDEQSETYPGSGGAKTFIITAGCSKQTETAAVFKRTTDKNIGF